MIVDEVKGRLGFVRVVRRPIESKSWKFANEKIMIHSTAVSLPNTDGH